MGTEFAFALSMSKSYIPKKHLHLITNPLYSVGVDRELVITKQAQKELKSIPHELMADIYSLLDELLLGKKLEMPVSRPLPSIAKGLHELRLSAKAGEYRVFYVLQIQSQIYILHVAIKKKQELDRKTSELIKTRMKSLGLKI